MTRTLGFKLGTIALLMLLLMIPLMLIDGLISERQAAKPRPKATGSVRPPMARATSSVPTLTSTMSAPIAAPPRTSARTVPMARASGIRSIARESVHRWTVPAAIHVRRSRCG